MRRALLNFTSVLALAAGAPALAHAQAAPAAAGSPDDPRAQPGQISPEPGVRDDTEVGEVVISARKRTERLRDVPVAASVIGADTIDSRGGLTGVKDLVNNIPSVAFGDTSTPLTSEISIRGSGTSRGTSAGSGVGLYRSGAYVGGGQQGGRTFSRFDLFDISQIEALRGTQGALYGRDAVGGAINIITAKPSFTESSYVRASAGNVEYGEVETVINHVLTPKLAFRFSMDLMSQPGGFYRNDTLDAYIDAQATHGYRAQLRYLDGPLDANLSVERAVNKYPALNLQLYIQPTANYPKGVFIEPMFSRPHNTKDLDKDEVNQTQFSLTYGFNFGTLNLITLFRDRRSLQQFDNDLYDQGLANLVTSLGLTAPGFTIDPNGGRKNQGHTTTVNQQAYLNGVLGSKVHWLVGGEYLHIDDADTVVIQRTPTRANTSIGTSAPTSQTLESYAAYGSVTYDVTSRLGLTGQLRYTNDSKDFYANLFDLGTGVATAGRLVTGVFNPDNTSYDVTASYKFLTRWLGYVKVGSGFRAGGFNDSLGDPRQPIPVAVSFGNESTTSYELGVKGNITRNIFLTAAGYYTDIDNLIIQTDNGCRATNPACPVAQTNFATDGGAAYVSGFEFETTVNYPLFGGTLFGTVGGSVQSGKITSGVYNNLTPPQLPRYLSSASLNYSHSLPWGWSGTGNLTYSARWGGVQEIAQTPELHDYQLLNGRVAVRKGRVEIAGYMRNVADYTYLSFEAAAARRFTTPRTYGGQVTYRW